MDLNTAKQLVGEVVQDSLDGSTIWGILEYVTADGWAGIRAPEGRIDEIQAWRVYADPT